MDLFDAGGVFDAVLVGFDFVPDVFPESFFTGTRVGSPMLMRLHPEDTIVVPRAGV